VKRWRVPLPRGAEPPYRVFVNGVPQREGADYEVASGELRFFRPLEKERLGLGRWTAIFLGLFGSYDATPSRPGSRSFRPTPPEEGPFPRATRSRAQP
jgi:hypothetical protein